MKTKKQKLLIGAEYTVTKDFAEYIGKFEVDKVVIYEGLITQEYRNTREGDTEETVRSFRLKGTDARFFCSPDFSEEKIAELLKL